LEGSEHVTEAIYKEQTEKRNREENARKQSRATSEQRLDENGNPANLFELLKKDPREQGYYLQKVFFLKLEHGLMAFFPAVIDQEKRVIVCLDKSLLVDVWKSLEPRASKMDSLMCFVNEQKGISYSYDDHQYEQERIKPEKILTRKEYEVIRVKTPDAIAWAPGLIGENYLDPELFPMYVDRIMANNPQ
jgi:hypothetical protein